MKSPLTSLDGDPAPPRHAPVPEAATAKFSFVLIRVHSWLNAFACGNVAFWLCATLLFAGCGYHTAGHAVRLPANVQVIAIPGFINKTQTYRVEQVLTQEVVREFIGRTQYRVINAASADAQATLKGIVLSAKADPLTYDAQTGRASSAMITVAMKVTLEDRSGKVLFEDRNYVFREQYQVSREIASFFDEETPALQRMSRDFARTLVSDILEAY
ncbi:MAG TPA: LPS assembly lipoprotein LptE [Candidatus Saccharimonadales bacterium]|nr:LPS assembly lipoprotein LptE [Candidatus Saccharimonadales bacterium]